MALIIDIFDLALKGKSVAGEVAVRDLPELRAFLASDAGSVRFWVEGCGERRGRPAARLRIEGEMEMPCARCNKPVPVEIDSEAVFLLTKTEAEANAMPVSEDEEDEDVVVGSRRFNVDAWVQEEAILSLPASAVHEEACDEDMWTDEPEEAAAALEKPNPFAALAGLKFGK